MHTRMLPPPSDVMVGDVLDVVRVYKFCANVACKIDDSCRDEQGL